MHKLFRTTIIGLLIILLLIANTTLLLAQWGDISVCVWFYGGCFVDVWQYSSGNSDLTWTMSIRCFFPYYSGSWSGSGGWGGECRSFWYLL